MKGRHTTLDKHLKANVEWIENLEGVQKVVLGISEACRHKYPPGHIKIKMDMEGGITINCYSGKGITNAFIKINPITLREHIKLLISEKFTLI